MSDDDTKPDAEPVDLFDLISWMSDQGEPLTLPQMIALRAGVEAGTIALTDREKAFLANAGYAMGRMLHQEARRMFEKEAPSIIASLMARMGPRDEGEGGGNPGGLPQ